MRRLYPYLLGSLVTFLLLGVGPSLVGEYILACVFQGASCTPDRNILSSLVTRGPYLLFALLLLTVLTLVARRDHLRHEALRKFSFVKLVADLRPEDFGYLVAKPEDKVRPDRRPFYETYIARHAAPAPDSETGNASYEEETLATQVSAGTGFVLLGPPLSGKSRTLYETVKRLDGFVAMAPPEEGGLPEDEAFSRLVKGKRVIVVLEDLNDYVARGFPLRRFVGRLSLYAKDWAIVATCRDGPEMTAIKGAMGTDAGRFYEEIPIKLVLKPLDTEEKKDLARSIGKHFDPASSDLYPTPGSIVMEDSMGTMRARFERVLSPEQKDALRAILLLAIAGIPFAHRRLHLVMKHPNLFKREGVHIRDCLETLTDQAFLQPPALQDPVRPEPAYLLNAVDYAAGKEPEDDFLILIDTLEEDGDAEGLLYFGARLGFVEDYEQALPFLDRAVRLKSDYPEAWVNKGIALYKLGRYKEALEAQEEALALRPDYPDALVNKANTLDELNRREEALDSLDRALELRPGFPDALNSRGVVFHKMGRYEESLTACDQALSQHADYPEALLNKAVALQQLARREQAQNNHARWLEYNARALAAYNKALNLRPNYTEALIDKGNVLDEMGQPIEALRCYDRALELSASSLEALYNKGVALHWMGRHSEASDAMDRVLTHNPKDPHASMIKGLALSELGKPDEAVAWLCQAWQARERLYDGGHIVSETLLSLGHDPTFNC